MPKKFHLIIFTVSLLLIQQSFFAQTKKTHSLKAFDNIFETIRGGAPGYLLKHESNASIRNAITEVLEYGGAPISPAIARKTLQLLSAGTSSTASSCTTLDHFLSEREMEILKHTVNGWDAKRIAIQLDISVLTVRKHIANIYIKLHVNSKAQIISLAHKNHWFS